MDKLIINKELVPNRVIKFQLDSVGKYIINTITIDNKFNQVRWNNNVLRFMVKDSTDGLNQTQNSNYIIYELYVKPSSVSLLDELVELINKSWSEIDKSNELILSNQVISNLIQYKNNQYQFSLPIIPVSYDREDKVLHTKYDILFESNDETLIESNESNLSQLTETEPQTKNIYLKFSHNTDGLWELLGVKPFVINYSSVSDYLTVESNYTKVQYNSNTIITPYKLVNPVTNKLIDKNTTFLIDDWMFKTTIQQQFSYNFSSLHDLNIYLYSSDIYETTLNLGSNQPIYTITDYEVKFQPLSQTEYRKITLDLNIRELTINPNQQYFIYIDTVDGYGFNSMCNAQLEVSTIVSNKVLYKE